MSAPQNTVTDTAARPRRLTAAALLTAAEGLAIALSGLYMVGLAAFGHPVSAQQALFGGVTVLVLSALPLAAVRGLLAARRWSRGPAIATQLVALPVGWTMIGTSGWLPAGVTVMAVAVLTLVLLVNPATTDALGIRRSG